MGESEKITIGYKKAQVSNSDLNDVDIPQFSSELINTIKVLKIKELNELIGVDSKTAAREIARAYFGLKGQKH